MPHLTSKPLLILSGASVLITAWFFSPIPAHAQTVVNYDFEDGLMRGSATHMKVRPKIMTEGSNNFLRITGSAEDRNNVPPPSAPPPWNRMNRSLVTVTNNRNDMPIVTSANMHQTYSADMRFDIPITMEDNLFELHSFGTPQVCLARFQYVARDFGVRRGGHVYFHENSDCNATDRHAYYDLGVVAPNTWHNYMIKGVCPTYPTYET